MKSTATHLLLLSLIICLYSCYPVYNLNRSPEGNDLSHLYGRTLPSKPGSCYAKCIMPPLMEYDTLNLAIYTEDDHQSNPKVDTRTIVTTPASTMWTKKKADVNCLSDNPEDCLVWCLEEVPAIVETHHVLTDTIGSDDYRIKEVLIGEILSPCRTDWKEILCADEMESIKPQLSARLSDLGYLDLATADFGVVKKALIAYQKANGLPRGNLDFETLDALGVAY